MASWNHLSKETRQEIIKRLDFRTRFRFRHVSKTNQLLVDTVPLYIPRIVVKVKDGDAATLTVYLGIEKKIVVEFEKATKEEIMHTVVSCNGSFDDVGVESVSDIIKIHTEKLVKGKNAIVPAFRALKHIAMHTNTLLGGLEFRDMDNVSKFMPFIQSIFGNAMFRTKVLCLAMSQDFTFCAHCSPEDLLEHQVMPSRPGWTMLVTYTDSVEYSMAERDFKRWEDDEKGTALLDQEYILTGYKNVKDTFSPGSFKKFINLKSTVMNGPNDYTSVVTRPDGYPHHIRINSCGFMSKSAASKFKMLTEQACEMRWTCAKHADPFEHWYYKTVVFQPKPWDRPAGCFKISGKPCYDEQICPIVNGKSLLKGAIEQTRLVYTLLGGRIPTGVKDEEPVILVEKLEKINNGDLEIQEITEKIASL